MISKQFSIFTILLALLLTFGHNSYSQGVSDDEIILGMHTDISGPVSSFGKYSVEGVQMRIDEINKAGGIHGRMLKICLLYTSPSPRDPKTSRMPSSA